MYCRSLRAVYDEPLNSVSLRQRRAISSDPWRKGVSPRHAVLHACASFQKTDVHNLVDNLKLTILVLQNLLAVSGSSDMDDMIIPSLPS